MSWELGKDAHESKGASPTSAHPVPGPAGSSGSWLDRKEPWDRPQSPLTAAKAGHAWGSLLKSRVLCASPDGYLLEVYPQGLRNKLWFCGPELPGTRGEGPDAMPASAW